MTNKQVVEIAHGPGAAGFKISMGGKRFESSNSGTRLSFSSTNWGGINFGVLGQILLQSNAAVFRYKGDTNVWNGAASLISLIVNTSFPTKPALEVRANADNGPVLS